MSPELHKHCGAYLALQVSPCLTLGLLLVASLSARAAGIPCDIPAFLQRSASPTQLSANLLSGPAERELLTLLGLDSVAAVPVLTHYLSKTPIELNRDASPVRPACQHYTPAQPRAP